MPTTLTDAERRHKAAIVRAARMGGSLAVLVRAALAKITEHIPDRPGPHDLVRVRGVTSDVCEKLRAALGERFRRQLMTAAEREHWLSAVEFTRATRGVREQLGEYREGWRDYARLILPAPALSFLEQIVGPLWRRITGAVDSERAGNAVLQGIAAGKDRRQIVRDLTDVFDGMEGRARRTARTAGLQVAVSTQLAVSEQVPELVIGYQIYSVLDERVRPEHRARHGFQYYRNPKKGQRGMDEMPRPPFEADGRVAWNCRCGLTPILEIDGEEV